MQPNSQELIDLDSNCALLTEYLKPSVIFQTLSGLSGTPLDAQKSLQFPGVQFQVPENITARKEHIRWFGVILLDVLYMANTLTGTDNNMGLGINRLPDNTWFCDNTLRHTSIYVSIKLPDLLVIGLLVGGITVVSYTLPDCLYRFIRTATGQQDKWWRLIGASLISFTLHDVMHLYRIALKGTTGQDLSGTLSTMPVFKGKSKRDGGKAPYYGIAAWDYLKLLRGDNGAQPGEEPEDVELQDNQSTNDDAASHTRSENSQLPNESSESVDDSAIFATARTTNESAAETDDFVDSDLESVDDEVDDNEVDEKWTMKWTIMKWTMKWTMMRWTHHPNIART